MPDRLAVVNRAAGMQMVWGGVMVVAGAVGLFVARDTGFAWDRGPSTGWPRFEVYLMTFTPLGALITIAVGVVGFVAGRTRSVLLAVLATSVSALLVLQVLVQWRENSDNLLGSSGQTMAFALASALVFAVTGWVTARLASGGDDRSELQPDEPKAATT